MWTYYINGASVPPMRALYLFVLVSMGHGTVALNYQCMVCPVGKYKSATVNNACTDCPINTYQDVLGATSSTQCKPCPTNSYAPAASGSNTACLCGLGYTGHVGNYTTGVRNLNLQRSCGVSLSDACVTLQNRDVSIYVPSRAVDTDLYTYSGSTMSDGSNGLFYQGMTSTWWRVRFERQAIVQQLEIYNLDPLKMTSFSIRVGNIEPFARMAENPLCASNVAWPAGESLLSVTCTQALQGQYLYIINGNSGSMYLYDVKVAGYLLPASEPCVACDTGTYKPSNGSATCTSCAPGKASAVVAATASSTCTTCGIGTYAGQASSACTSCPQYSNTLTTASQALSFCTCNAGYAPAPSTVSCTAFQGLYQAKRPWAHYSAENWNAQTQILADTSGNNRNTKATGNRAGISMQTGPDPFNRGSPNTIPYLRGTVTDQVYFADNSVPLAFTICSVTRYASTSVNQQRILTTTSPSWYHGHYSGMRGVGRFASRTIRNAQGAVIATPVSNTLDESVDPTSNWLVMCSKNGGVVPFNVLVDGVASGTSTRSDGNVSEWTGDTLQEQIDAMEAGRTKNMCINCNGGQASDWDLAQLLIWDTHLTDSEMQTVSTELRRYAMPSATACSVTPGVGCNACAPGTYNADPGSPCTNCGAGKYRTAPAANDERLCLDCPANTFSGSGSALLTNCSCNAGYSGITDGQICTACTAGTFKTTVGIGTCTNCPADQYSTAVAQVTSVCTSCPENSQGPAGSSTATTCQCNVGYTGANGQQCLACVQGTYKTTVGAQWCTLCGNNTFSSVVAANSSSVCVACQSNSSSNRGSTRQSDCHCFNGFLTKNLGSNNATCQMCSAGTYNADLDATTCSKCGAGTKSSTPGAVTAEQCTACAANTFSAEGAAQCDICPINTFAPVRSDEISDCQCNAGYYSLVAGQSGFTCAACEGGKYKSQTGPVSCIDCPANTYSNTSAATSNATCQACSANSVSSMGSSSSIMCSCDSGFQPGLPIINLATSCYARPGGGCLVISNAIHAWCGGVDQARGCVTDGIINGLYLQTGLAVGQGIVTVDFQRQNTVKGVTVYFGANPVSLTAVSVYVSTVDTSISANRNAGTLCSTLPTVSPSSTVSVSCARDMIGQYVTVYSDQYAYVLWREISITGYGEGLSQSVCDACPAGKFKSTTGSGACTNCPPDTYSGQTGARNASVCTRCYDNSVSPAGSDAMDDCTCSAGYEFS